MKLGQKTKKVWAGDLVHECEFISFLEDGKMLFYDVSSKVFRKVYIEIQKDDEICLNGWTSASFINELLNK